MKTHRFRRFGDLSSRGRQEWFYLQRWRTKEPPQLDDYCYAVMLCVLGRLDFLKTIVDVVTYWHRNCFPFAYDLLPQVIANVYRRKCRADRKKYFDAAFVFVLIFSKKCNFFTQTVSCLTQGQVHEL